MSKLRAHKPAHTTNPRQKAAIQPPWWNKETQAAWTDKRTMVKLWQKERSKPHPDLTIKALMEEKTEVFKRVASEAKDRQWKSFCDTLNRDTTLTHFWLFYRQMEGCAANTNTPDLIDASGSVLKTSKEKSSALLQRFVQQSNQNNLDERKAVWEGLDRTLTEAGSNDDMITAVQEQLEKVSHWCQETESEINPSKAQALWCTLNNKAVGQAMPAVSFNGEAIERTNSLRYLGIHFDRMLTYKTQVESTKLTCKKGLSVLKAMASKGIEQRHLFLLFQSVILSVIDYGLGLTTLSQSNLLTLDRVQNEAMRVILGTTKDTPIETMRYLLDLPSMETRHKVEQVKAYLSAMQNPKNPLHDAVKEEKGCRLARGKSWMGQAEQSIQRVCSLTELKQVRDWEKRPVEFKPYYKTLLSENLGTHCREWPAGKTNAEVQMLVEANSKPHDIVIYTDGSVTRDRSGWGFTVKQDGRTVHEDSGAHRVTTSSLTMEVDAVTHAIQWLASQRDARITHAIILTDSMNLLQKMESGMG